MNGSKTFISGGLKSDYFVVGVNTAAQGVGREDLHGALSLLLLTKDMPGIKVTRLKTQGWWASSTTTIAFEDVRVPAENKIGEKGEGFMAIMQNFNKERRTMAVYANRFSRICYEDALSYARKRKTFDKHLIEHQ